MSRKNLRAAMLAGIILLAGIVGNAQAAELDRCYTGSWYDPARDGEGINIEVLDDQVVAYFYQFAGFAGRAWFSMLGARTASPVPLTMRFTDGDGSRSTGDAMITAIDDNTLQFDYTLDFDFTRPDPVPWCIGCAESLIYTRVTQPLPCR